MATNQLLPFASGESPNVIPFNDWNSLPARLTGFQSGIASSQQFNYILAQGGVAGYILGQLIVDQLNQDATLDPESLYTNWKNAIATFIPANVADSSINGAKILDASLNAAKIIDATITAAKLVDKTISTAKIADLAITAAKIASKTITQAQIADATLTFAKIAAEAIATTEEAKAGSVNNKLMTPQLVAQAIAEQIPPAIPTPKAYVTETWSSGTSGYLVWSDGFIDQWGQISTASSGQTVTFSKAFSNTPNVVTSANTLGSVDDNKPSHNWSYAVAGTVTKVSTTSFSVVSTMNNLVRWRACGY